MTRGPIGTPDRGSDVAAIFHRPRVLSDYISASVLLDALPTDPLVEKELTVRSSATYGM